MERKKCILLKTSPEITLKSDKVKRDFVRQLVKNINILLKKNGIEKPEYVKYGGRLVLHSEKLEDVGKLMKKMPGINAIAYSVEFKNTELKNVVKNVLKELDNSLPAKGTFSVRAKAKGMQEYSSKDLESALGKKILEKNPSLIVNLDEPDFTIHIEVRGESCYLIIEEEKGLGGLPLGVEGNVALLMQGREKEFEAGLQIMKRGCNIYPIAINDSPEINNTIEKLKPFNLGRNFIITPIREIENIIKEHKLLAVISAETDIVNNTHFSAPLLQPFALLPESVLKNELEGIE